MNGEGTRSSRGQKSDARAARCRALGSPAQRGRRHTSPGRALFAEDPNPDKIGWRFDSRMFFRNLVQIQICKALRDLGTPGGRLGDLGTPSLNGDPNLLRRVPEKGTEIKGG